MRTTRRIGAPHSKVPPMTDPTDEAAVARAARARGGTPFLTPEQAAYYLGLSVRTLQGYRSDGSGPRYRRHSRHVRYHIDDLDAWSQRLGEAGDHE
ncbi:hypothetical protein MGWOODY_Smn3474 [hydrothermal vent metagenome]|uniref:Helix-turn-helix domain-containing protein n=1 Tax=hydrothermal vent metagenome TaxID=652676 RepID=A0A160TFN4_9ZZZZ